MWGGAFFKHRDYAHNSVFEHIMAHGGSYWIDPAPVRVKYNPIDARLHAPSKRYYFVDVQFAHGEKSPYEYLVRAEADLSEPNEDNIMYTVNAYAANPVDGGRDWFEYIDHKHPESLANPRVAARQQKEPIPMGPPRHFNWQSEREARRATNSKVGDIFS